MTIKLCIDCRHALLSEPEMCKKGRQSPVNGKYMDTCEDMREDGNYLGHMIVDEKCGPDGEWWEPRAKAAPAK